MKQSMDKARQEAKERKERVSKEGNRESGRGAKKKEGGPALFLENLPGDYLSLLWLS